MRPEEVVAAYVSAWAEPDEVRRLATLATCWTLEGTYVDPSGRADGRAALCEHIGEFQRSFVGHRLELASGVDEHDGYLRFAWTMFGPDGGEVMEGVDFGQLDGEGRLRMICGFFGPFPQSPGS